MIKRIRNDEGSWVEGDTDLKKLIFSYYSELFKVPKKCVKSSFHESSEAKSYSTDEWLLISRVHDR